MLPCCCTCKILLVDMQHYNIPNKLNFNLLTPSPGSGGGGGSAVKIFAIMLLHSCISLI